MSDVLLGSLAKVGERRILLIEDDPETQRLFGEILGEDGFEVTSCAHNDLPERDGATLVITDLDHGSRTYSSESARFWIRQLRERYLAPVFVITGHAEASKDDALRHEAIDVMCKPIDIDDLTARLGVAFDGVAP